MRIAMLTSNYKPFVGGVPISVERLAEGLRRQGHTVFVFAPECGDCVDDIWTYRFQTVRPLQSGGFRFQQLFDQTVYRIFPTLGVELIHVHDPFLVGHMALRLGRKYHIPVIFTHHTRYEQYLHYVGVYAAAEARARAGHPVTAGLLREVRERWLPERVAAFENRCSAVIAPSESMRQELLRLGVVRPVQAIPTGLPESAFSWDAAESVRLRRQLAGDRPYLLCTVSRLGREKNLETLLRCMVLLKEQIGAVFRLAVLGEGPQRAALETLRDCLGLREEVTFCGAAENSSLASYHRASDVFVFTSRTETQSIVLLEAMAAGCPVVALRTPGPQDVIRDGLNGFLTCEADFAPRIAELLRSASLRKSLSSGALYTARCFTADEIARRAEAFYCEVCAGWYSPAQRALLVGGASYADSARGRGPLDSRWGQ